MYAFAVVTTETEGQEIVAARQGPPLVIGLCEGEQFLASDPAALLVHTKDVIFLENGDLARLDPGGRRDLGPRRASQVERPVQRLNWDPIQAEKGGYKHFMLKEIHEQPQAVQDTFAGRVDFENGRDPLRHRSRCPRTSCARIERIHLLACGTSWHAGLVGKFLIEELARIPVEVDYGSEYRYRDADRHRAGAGRGHLAVGRDRGHALGHGGGARARARTCSPSATSQGSQATRISEGVIYTHAGPEIGVASTKAFTTQLVALYLLALYLRQLRTGKIERALPGRPGPPAAGGRRGHPPAGEAHGGAGPASYHRAENFLYLGRGINYPIALEGALKLKEISYIHAEGYPAGEMKHGPIALIDEDMPVVAIATGSDQVFEKVKSNMQEVKARDGVVIALTDRDPEELGGICDEVIEVPTVSPLLQPIVNVIPLQLLAYFIGVRRGADVDQPRNLAKSVTVE